MRVLLWSESFRPQIGGAEIFGSRLVAGLSGRGHRFRIVTAQHDPALGEYEQGDGFDLHRIPFWCGGRDPGELHRLRGRIAALKREFAPDLVHLSAIGPSALFHLWTMETAASPTLVSVHGRWRTQLDSLMDRILQAASGVVACSRWMVELLRHGRADLAARIDVVAPGVLETPPSPGPPPRDPARLLFVGRLVREKGADLALAALALLRSRHPGIRLTIAGGGAERVALARQAQRLGLDDGALDWTGWVEPNRVPALIDAATVVVMPSREEAFGLVALEAALAGRAVVAARVGGLAELVEHDRTGVLVAPDNPAALAAGIESLLEPDRLDAISRAARARALAAHGPARWLNEYDRCYRELAGR
jgi:glycosyltransferase involved in cell wall biosynthesis